MSEVTSDRISLLTRGIVAGTLRDRAGEELRQARGIFVSLARETGYTLTDLQRILKRDVSVLSRLATIGETAEGEKLL